MASRALISKIRCTLSANQKGFASSMYNKPDNWLTNNKAEMSKYCKSQMESYI